MHTNYEFLLNYIYTTKFLKTWYQSVISVSSKNKIVQNISNPAIQNYLFANGYLIHFINSGLTRYVLMIIVIFQGLDFVISEAGKYGIRLILSLSNNWQDFGGKQQYVNWARSAGVYISNEDDFYTNDVLKGYYKNHVQVSKSIIIKIATKL